MRSIGTSLLVSLALLLSTCDEMARSRFASAGDARRDIAYRNLIPSALPDSAYEIFVECDLDTNTAQGSFRFTQADTDSLRSRLQPLPAGVQSWGFRFDRAQYERQGFEFFHMEKFCIAVNWIACEAHFWFDPRA